MTDNAARLDKLLDLTRWNRAGLPRFQYVDGDAAVWLEELRLAMQGLVARGAAFDERLPETWRHRFADDADQWPSEAERAAFVEAMAWKALARAYPDRPETARSRNRRLLAQYQTAPSEYGWEIMRAAARASHVLLGHQNAYANEGYLRTATQWDNLRKLAAMVNHQPAPPTSATTMVGLLVDPTDDGAAVEIDRGLAMKYAPPEGGPPVVFETLTPIKVHEDLNEARAVGWDFNPNEIGEPEDWIDNDEAELAPGALAVISNEANTGDVDGVLMTEVTRGGGIATISLFDVDLTWIRGDSLLNIDPKDIRRGLPRSTAQTLVLKMDTAANYAIRSLVKIYYYEDGAEKSAVVAVIGNTDGHLKLDVTDEAIALASDVTVVVETLVPVTNTAAAGLAPQTLGLTAYFFNSLGNLTSGDGEAVPVKDEDGEDLKAILGNSYSAIADVVGTLYTTTEGAKRENGKVVAEPPVVVPENYQALRIISFAGKPPKGLAVGDLMAMRKISGGQPSGLRVEGISVGEDSYSLQFHINLSSTLDSFFPDERYFHGPMKRSIRPVDYNRNPLKAFSGGEIVVEGLSQAAREQVRLGKQCLIEDERGAVETVLATVLEALEDDGEYKIIFEPGEQLGEFLKGWTKLNMNAVAASHGETKSPKSLGSGDAEKPYQKFPFSARNVSFIPSSVAETGVAPDMDVFVDGALWTYRDLIDPTADGLDAWSVSQDEGGKLTVHFRRRLPTGADNAVVRRYRTGVGPRGSVPERSFRKPQKKHRYVRGLTQPFPATGGAEREPVEDIRVNAPARLAANGRAVSLADFERLCRRRSDVWRAKARAVADPTKSEDVAITIVPANGGDVGVTLREDLTEFVEARALPGVRVAIEDFTPINLTVTTTVRVDIEAFDKSLVLAAAQSALAAAFSLEKRALGQPLYISEVVATLERVEGVETAIVTGFALKGDGEDRILRTGETNDKPSAFFPLNDQVIFADPETIAADLGVTVEAL